MNFDILRYMLAHTLLTVQCNQKHLFVVRILSWYVGSKHNIIPVLANAKNSDLKMTLN